MATEEGRLANTSKWAAGREKLGSVINREKLGTVFNKEKLGNTFNREKLASTFNREKLGAVNVGKTERWASVLGGAALAALALRSRNRSAAGKSALGLAALAGLPLLLRGATGHCPVYQKMGIDRVHGNGAGTSLASDHVSADTSFDEGRVTRLDERTEGRPVINTDRQPIGQTF